MADAFGAPLKTLIFLVTTPQCLQEPLPEARQKTHH
jgi:hypothetical protein